MRHRFGESESLNQPNRDLLLQQPASRTDLADIGSGLIFFETCFNRILLSDLAAF